MNKLGNFITMFKVQMCFFSSMAAGKTKKIILACAVVLLCCSIGYAQEKVYVYAAASTTDLVKELIDTYQKSSKSKAKFLTSFASSGTLARQIDAGADADIFISANMKWFKFLEDKQVIEKKSVYLLAENSLVIISSPKTTTTLKSPKDLPELLGESHLAMGDPSHVPAGKYGEEALKYHKIWDELFNKKKIAFYATVRVALNAVETSQTDYGIVYRTDARQSEKSRIVYTFSNASHKPILYPVGALRGKDRGEAHAFLQFLKSSKAKEILKKHGFIAK